MKKLILTHANCVDGCCSRAILENIYGEDAHYVAVEHTDYDPKFPDKVNQLLEQVKNFQYTEVIMSDICLPLSWIDMFLDQHNKVTIIDHHKTATNTINILEQRMKDGENIDVEVHFCADSSKSGALLTWEYANPNKAVPEVVQLISEGDIWDFRHEETKPFYTGLLHNKEPKDYSPQEWIELLTDPQIALDIISKGRPLHEEFMQQVKSYIPKAQPITLGGRSGMMVMAPSEYRSELGNLLSAQFNGFALIIDVTPERVSCRLNSIAPNCIDDLAIKFGGGGHAQSSGFKLKNLDELEDLLKKEGNNITFEQCLKKTKFKP